MLLIYIVHNYIQVPHHFHIHHLHHVDKRLMITSTLMIRNLGYQIIPYYSGNRERLPLELLLSVSNRLQHMPLRWTLSFQHIEKFDLTFNNSTQSVNFLNTENSIGLGQKILRHCVFSTEFLFSWLLIVQFGLLKPALTLPPIGFLYDLCLF